MVVGRDECVRGGTLSWNVQVDNFVLIALHYFSLDLSFIENIKFQNIKNYNDVAYTVIFYHEFTYEFDPALQV